MGIYRIQKDKDNPYVTVNKKFVEDWTLSWKAKGILLYLLSKPDDWKVYETEIAERSRDGLDSVKAGIKELIKYGYIKRTRKQNRNGTFAGFEYDVFETPPNKESQPLLEFPSMDKPALLNNDITNAEKGLRRIGNKYYNNGRRIKKAEYQAICISQVSKEAWPEQM